MLPTNTTPNSPLFDELTQWQLSIARRADELMREHQGRSDPRDFWNEAENEFMAAWRARGNRETTVG
jgi:hypothetical protein